jgi:hypothetical protein
MNLCLTRHLQMGCSAARDQKIDCAECAVLTSTNRGNHAEGDRGMIPDCHLF